MSCVCIIHALLHACMHAWLCIWVHACMHVPPRNSLRRDKFLTRAVYVVYTCMNACTCHCQYVLKFPYINYNYIVCRCVIVYIYICPEISLHTCIYIRRNSLQIIIIVVPISYMWVCITCVYALNVPYT